MNQTDWLSAAAMLLSGLVVGFMIIYTMGRKRARQLESDVKRRDLEARRDQLIAALRDLRDDPVHEAERARLESEAAAVLRQLDQQMPAIPGAVPRPAATPATGTLRGFVWGAGSMAVLALLGFLVMQASKERAPGGSVTGDVPASGAPAPAASDAELQALEASVQRSPDDLAARNRLAKAYLDRQNLMAVFEQTQYVLQKSPNDPQALTFGAIVRMAMGEGDEAMKMLRGATASDPTMIEAWVSIAWLHTAEKRDTEAAAAIEEAAKRHPEERARLLDVLQQMRAQRDQEMAARGAPAASTPAPPSSAGTIRVTVEAGGAVPAPGAILFVIARAEGVTSGPPIAAKRVPASSFPITVEISGADSMMGQALPPRVRVEARIDSDGVATTRDPKDPSGAQDGVALGSDVKIVLK